MSEPRSRKWKSRSRGVTQHRLQPPLTGGVGAMFSGPKGLGRHATIMGKPKWGNWIDLRVAAISCSIG